MSDMGFFSFGERGGSAPCGSPCSGSPLERRFNSVPRWLGKEAFSVSLDDESAVRFGSCLVHRTKSGQTRSSLLFDGATKSTLGLRGVGRRCPAPRGAPGEAQRADNHALSSLLNVTSAQLRVEARTLARGAGPAQLRCRGA